MGWLLCVIKAWSVTRHCPGACRGREHYFPIPAPHATVAQTLWSSGCLQAVAWEGRITLLP